MRWRKDLLAPGALIGTLALGGCLPWGKATSCEPVSWYADKDGDGFGYADGEIEACDAPTEHVADRSDCDDEDAAVNPSATEICDDLDIDEDCDGMADGDDPDLADQILYRDADGDGYGQGKYQGCMNNYNEDPVSTQGGDCDDDDRRAHPGAEATSCANTLDADCDGERDCYLSGVMFVEDIALDALELYGTVPAAAGDLDGDGIEDAVIGDPTNDYVTFVFGGESWDDVAYVELDPGAGGWSEGSAMGRAFAAFDGGLAMAGWDGGILEVFEVDRDGGWQGQAEIHNEGAYLSRHSVGSSLASLDDGWVASFDYSFSYSSTEYNYVLGFPAWPVDGSTFELENYIADYSVEFDEVYLEYDYYIRCLTGAGCLSLYPTLSVGSLLDYTTTLSIARTGIIGPGRVKVFKYAGFGSATVTPDVTIDGTDDSDDFGSATAIMDNDALVVGAPGASGGAGAAYVFSGATLTASALTPADGAEVPGYEDYTACAVGTSLATGDLNDDGVDDLVIGAPGCAFVDIYLGPSSALEYVGTIHGDSDSELGLSVAIPGDLNADGNYDILVGSNEYVYLIPGGTRP